MTDDLSDLYRQLQDVANDPNLVIKSEQTYSIEDALRFGLITKEELKELQRKGDSHE